jgi:hypothetical protein
MLTTEDHLLNPYVKFGFILSQTSVKMDETITIKSTTIMRKWDYDISKAFGLTFATGLSYQLKDDFALRLGLNYQRLSVKPTSASMRNSKQNGNSNLDSYPVIEREILYTSHINESYNMSPDPTKPRLLHEIFFPYESLTIELGISVSLN